MPVPSGFGDRCGMTATRRPPRPGRRSRVRLASGAPWVFGVAGAVLLPWIVLLAYTLPSSTVAEHWRAAWVGLDGAEAVGLLATAILARRRDPRTPLVATVTATLLAVDAWFDILTSGPGDLPTALAQGVGLELPLAALCVTYAWRQLARHTAPVAVLADQPGLTPPRPLDDVQAAIPNRPRELAVAAAA